MTTCSLAMATVQQIKRRFSSDITWQEAITTDAALLTTVCLCLTQMHFKMENLSSSDIDFHSVKQFEPFKEDDNDEN